MKLSRSLGIIIVLALQLCLPACRPAAPTLPTPLPVTLQPNFLEDSNTACFFHKAGGRALTCLDRDGWHIYLQDENWTVKDLGVFTHCADGRTYLGGRNGILAVRHESSIWVPERPYIVEGDIIACGPRSELWVSSTLGNISHYDGSKWISPTKVFSGTEERTGFAVAPNGVVWLATGKRIASFDGNQWQSFEKGNDFNGELSSYSWGLNELAVDSSGTVWAGTVTGLIKYDGARWLTVNGINQYVYGVIVSLDDQIWIATSTDIYKLDPKTNQIIQVLKGEAEANNITAMQFDRRGRLWVATEHGLSVYDGSTWVVYHTDTADIFANSASGLIVMGDGPSLPALVQKAPGSVSANFGAQNAGKQMEICVIPPPIIYSDTTPCSNQPFHQLAAINSDGSILFQNLPAGRYYSIIQKSIESSLWSYSISFVVKAGEETKLGNIDQTQ